VVLDLWRCTVKMTGQHSMILSSPSLVWMVSGLTLYCSGSSSPSAHCDIDDKRPFRLQGCCSFHLLAELFSFCVSVSDALQNTQDCTRFVGIAHRCVCVGVGVTCSYLVSSRRHCHHDFSHATLSYHIKNQLIAAVHQRTTSPVTLLPILVHLALA